MFVYMSKLSLFLPRTQVAPAVPPVGKATETPQGENTTASLTNAATSGSTLYNSTYLEPPVYHEDVYYSHAEYVGYVFIIPIICGLGSLFNILVIIVFTRRHFRGTTYTYLSALAFSDVITLLLTLPIGMSRCGPCDVTDAGYFRLFYEIYIYIPITNMSETVSAWMTIVLAVERYARIRKPIVTTGDPAKSLRWARSIVGIICVMASALNAPYFFIMTISTDVSLAVTEFGNSVGFGVFSWIRACAVQFIPLIVLVCLNILLVRELRQKRPTRKITCAGAKPSMRAKAEKRLSMMLVGTVFLFVCGHVPIAFSYSTLFETVFGEDVDSELYRMWRVATHALALTSYSCNFLVYVSVNRQFRQVCSEMFCPHKHTKVADSSSGKEDQKTRTVTVTF